MSKDAAPGQAEIGAPSAAHRRDFVKRVGMAALGASAAAPFVGAGAAHADGAPAYTDSPNKFTADQTFTGHTGFGSAPSSSFPVYMRRDDIGAACYIDAYTQGLVVRQYHDWEG